MSSRGFRRGLGGLAALAGAATTASFPRKRESSGCVVVSCRRPGFPLSRERRSGGAGKTQGGARERRKGGRGKDAVGETWE